MFPSLSLADLPFRWANVNAEKEVHFGPCCFCGEELVETELDPCRVTVETANGKWQVWFCHSACFRDRLVPEPHFEPAHF